MKLDTETTTWLATCLVLIIQQTYTQAMMHRGMKRVGGIRTQAIDNGGGIIGLHEKVDRLSETLNDLKCRDKV